MTRKLSDDETRLKQDVAGRIMTLRTRELDEVIRGLTIWKSGKAKGERSLPYQELDHALDTLLGYWP